MVKLITYKTPRKAKGYIFNRFKPVIDYTHIKFDFNLESIIEVKEEKYGSKMQVKEFIELCKWNNLINYDGFAKEFIFEGKVVFEKTFYPSDCTFYKEKLEQVNKELFDNRLEIMWYNR